MYLNYFLFRLNVQKHSGSNPGKECVASSQRKEDLRLTKMMLTIFISFLVCFLPLMLVNVIDDDVNVPTLHIIASVLAWMSATINPFIYAFKNRQYQQAFKKVQLLSSSRSRVGVQVTMNFSASVLRQQVAGQQVG